MNAVGDGVRRLFCGMVTAKGGLDKFSERRSREGLISASTVLQSYVERIQSLVLSSEFCKVFHSRYSVHRVFDERMISRNYRKSLVYITYRNRSLSWLESFLCDAGRVRNV